MAKRDLNVKWTPALEAAFKRVETILLETDPTFRAAFGVHLNHSLTANLVLPGFIKAVAGREAIPWIEYQQVYLAHRSEAVDPFNLARSIYLSVENKQTLLDLIERIKDDEALFLQLEVPRERGVSIPQAAILIYALCYAFDQLQQGQEKNNAR